MYLAQYGNRRIPEMRPYREKAMVAPLLSPQKAEPRQYTRLAGARNAARRLGWRSRGCGDGLPAASAAPPGRFPGCRRAAGARARAGSAAGGSAPPGRRSPRAPRTAAAARGTSADGPGYSRSDAYTRPAWTGENAR